MSFPVLNWENSVTGAILKGKIYTLFWDTDRTLSYIVGDHKEGVTTRFKQQVRDREGPIYAAPLGENPPQLRQPLAASVWKPGGGKQPYIDLFFVDKDRFLRQLVFNDAANTWKNGPLTLRSIAAGPYTSLWVSDGPHHKVVYTDPKGVLTELRWDDSATEWTATELSI